MRHVLGLDLGLEFSVSACSRAPRDNETDGIDYHFLSVDEFREKIERDAFIEWEEVYTDHYYGTLKSEPERIWKRDRHVVFDVDVMGGINLKKYLGSRALSIFVQPPSIEELEKRLRDRSTDSEADIQKRISKAETEMNFAGSFDIILINDVLEDTLPEAEEVIRKFMAGS